MKRFGILLFSVIALMSCTTAQEKGADVINKVVPAAEFKKLISDDVQLIDVRTADEYSKGKIGNAKNIDFYGANFKNEMAKLDKNKRTLVYCHSGGRSGKTASMLKSMGFKEVYDLKGGYSGWPYK